MRPATSARRFPDGKFPLPNPVAMLFLVLLWVTVGCALPLRQVHRARHEAREKLLHVLAAEKLDHAAIVTLFENANKDLDAAASGPCLFLAVSVIGLGWQLLRLRQKVHTADARAPRNRAAPASFGRLD